MEKKRKKKQINLGISPYTERFLDELVEMTGMNKTEIIGHAVYLFWGEQVKKEKAAEDQPGPVMPA